MKNINRLDNDISALLIQDLRLPVLPFDEFEYDVTTKTRICL